MYSIKKSEKTIAIFTPAIEGGFDVSFPSFPGCVTFGRTLGEAKRMAQEVLELWIEELGSTKVASSKKTIIADIVLPRLHKPVKRSRYESAPRQKAHTNS